MERVGKFDWLGQIWLHVRLKKLTSSTDIATRSRTSYKGLFTIKEESDWDYHCQTAGNVATMETFEFPSSSKLYSGDRANRSRKSQKKVI